MDAEKIIKLLDAGFSKEEIFKFLSLDTIAPAPSPEPAKAPEDPAPAPQPVEDPKPAPKEESAPAWLADLKTTLGSMTETLKSIQAANIRGAAAASDPKDAATIAAEILAEVIAPPAPKEK